jgi:hypothetical protein
MVLAEPKIRKPFDDDVINEANRRNAHSSDERCTKSCQHPSSSRNDVDCRHPCGAQRLHGERSDATTCCAQVKTVGPKPWFGLILPLADPVRPSSNDFIRRQSVAMPIRQIHELSSMSVSAHVRQESVPVGSAAAAAVVHDVLVSLRRVPCHQFAISVSCACMLVLLRLQCCENGRGWLLCSCMQTKFAFSFALPKTPPKAWTKGSGARP